MIARPLPRTLRRAGALAVCLAALAVTVSVFGTAPAAAQGFGWFGNLFGGGQPRQQQGYPGYGSSPSQGDDVYAPRRRVRRHPEAQSQPKRPPRQAPRDTAADKPAPKKSPTAFVYVFGDSFGQFLANGLDEALADKADVGVVSKAKGPSGIVNTEFYDWPKAIEAELASKDKVDVAVMMVGSNDRQPITEDGKTYQVGSDEWKAIYQRRVLAIDAAFAKKKIPLIWVGAPIAKGTDFADTMAALNDIDREAASKTGVTYVDTWEAFSDENGEFAAYGPDINGQNVRLRSADGILFTHAGARKLAHFVEAHVRRDLDGKSPAPALPTGQPAQAARTPDGRTPDGKAKDAKGEAPKPKPEAGPIANLNELPSAANGELASPTTDRGGESTLAKGDSAAAPSGRADDARWPGATPKGP